MLPPKAACTCDNPLRLSGCDAGFHSPDTVVDRASRVCSSQGSSYAGIHRSVSPGANPSGSLPLVSVTFSLYCPDMASKPGSAHSMPHRRKQAGVLVLRRIPFVNRHQPVGTRIGQRFPKDRVNERVQRRARAHPKHKNQYRRECKPRRRGGERGALFQCRMLPILQWISPR